MSASARDVVDLIQAQLPRQQGLLGAILAGSRAGGWGRPARAFRFSAETITPLVPAG